MGLFDLLKPRDIGEGVKTCKATAGAVLRAALPEAEEYRAEQVVYAHSHGVRQYTG